MSWPQALFPVPTLPTWRIRRCPAWPQREVSVEPTVEAGELAFTPLATDTFGVDIISISFDDDAVAAIEWRDTRNMAPIDDVLTRVAELAESGDGVLVVAIEYEFEPIGF